jgi:hypothetical protein
LEIEPALKSPIGELFHSHNMWKDLNLPRLSSVSEKILALVANPDEDVGPITDVCIPEITCLCGWSITHFASVRAFVQYETTKLVRELESRHGILIERQLSQHRVRSIESQPPPTALNRRRSNAPGPPPQIARVLAPVNVNSLLANRLAVLPLSPPCPKVLIPPPPPPGVIAPPVLVFGLHSRVAALLVPVYGERLSPEDGRRPITREVSQDEREAYQAIPFEQRLSDELRAIGLVDSGDPIPFGAAWMIEDFEKLVESHRSVFEEESAARNQVRASLLQNMPAIASHNEEALAIQALDRKVGGFLTTKPPKQYHQPDDAEGDDLG